MALAHENMRFVFLSIARFAHINRPLDGYYMEFGSHEGRTMRLAWRHFQHLFNWDYVAFDSFERSMSSGAADCMEAFPTSI